MDLRVFGSLCLMVLASASLSQAEISQYFDRSGRLVPAEKTPSSSQVQRVRSYSVPEGIELRPDLHYEFYPVFGKTYAQIVRSAEENSPRNKKTRKQQTSGYDWSLGWTYDFSYSLEPDDDNDRVHCDVMIIDPVLSYNITVILPALTDDSALNPTEKDLWKNYIERLLERVSGRIKIIRDDTRDVILKQMGEIGYISLGNEEADRAEQIAERYVRAETEKIGSTITGQIRQKLEAYDSGTTQDAGPRPATIPSGKGIAP